MRFHFLLAAALWLSAAVAAYNPNELPSPQKDPEACGRAKASAVCDPDGYLSPASADTVDGIINFIHEGSHGFLKNLECNSGPAGAEVAVAVVSNLHFGFGSKEDRAFQLAKDLHDRWGVGDAVCQNGVVLVLAIRDRAVGMSTGAGVKGVLKDNMVPAIIGVMKNDLREKQYGTALEKGVTAVGNIVSGGKPPSDNSGIGFLVVFGFFLSCCGLGACFDRRKRRRYARCKQVLHKIDEQRMAANSNSYVATSCPICLEDFSRASQEGESAAGETSKLSEDSAVATSERTKVQTITAEHCRVVIYSMRNAS
ncbi:Modulator of levamisole receptor-1 [Gracilaria domingensis]|nr:Modulator of levamisole receptor-1 [Gracilaria domingensis]